MQEPVEETRACYRPERITTLFVGESPPYSGKFFYYGNTALAHHMSSAMRAAGLLGDGDFLNRFKAYGWYLDDLVLEPLNRMTWSERMAACRNAGASLADRIAEYQPLAKRWNSSSLMPRTAHDALQRVAACAVQQHSLLLLRAGGGASSAWGLGDEPRPGETVTQYLTPQTLWFDTMHQGAIGSIDPKTGEIKYHPLPPEWNDNRVQLNFVGFRHDVDGKVWTKSVGTVDVFRLDLASGKWERFHPTDFLPPGQRYSIYQLISDSKNNVWMAEFEDGYLGKIDAKTLKVTWFPLPSPHGRARRMEIDDQDRILVTEYRANKLALFNTKTEQFTEYDLPPLTFPYRAQVDNNGDLWTGGMSTDRVVSLDPKTGTAVEYLMPSGTNMRTAYVDNSTTPVTFWVGSNHAHALVKVEPLD